ncbi:radical SAM protein [Omnitrophica bacterium]|nr:radical SAM protein [Candidatus Omnitrophota bacterium]
MNRAVLVDFTNVYSFSVRSISAYLKDKGYGVSCVHYRPEDPDDLFSPLSEKSLRLLAEHCQGSDVVGISILSTHFLNRAIEIRNYLKERIGAKILWGGVPVICDPHYYLKYTDYVCTGEGEIPMAGILGRGVPEEIAGIGYKSPEGEVIFNEAPPLLDLNEIPVPYLDMENTYILRDNALKSLREHPEPLFDLSKKGYRIFPIRGCPYSCTFCSNNRLKNAYREKGPLLRSLRPERIIAELKNAKEVIPGLERVMFYEDDFMARRDDELKELMGLYSRDIGLPFNINATIMNISEGKLDTIRRSGVELEYIKIGLQSASSRVNKEVFRRFFDRDTYLERLELLARRGIPVILDIISDNPYEALSDKYESLLFYHELSAKIRKATIVKRPIRIMDHKLMYYPGTALYDNALQDKIIDRDYVGKTLLTRRTTRDKREDIDNDTFISALFGLATQKRGLRIPNAILRVLRIRPIFNIGYRFNLFKFLASIVKGRFQK